jgi:hypothetical protein
MKCDELKQAYAPVPQSFHDALYFAAHNIREGTQVKKQPFKTALIIALIIALLCTSAVALNKIASVRDTWGGKPKTEDFLNHVIDLNKTYENEFMKLTLTDALFDGHEFEMAMNLEYKDAAKPVYLFPRTTAACNGENLYFDVEGMRGDFMSGFLYPNLIEGDAMNGDYGFSGVLMDEDVPGEEVTWTFALHILEPNWPVFDDSAEGGGTDGFSHEEYMAKFYKAYQNKQILTTWGESVVEYASEIEFRMDKGDEEFLRLDEVLIQSGAFSLVDTIEYSFGMPVPKSIKPKAATDITFEFDHFTLQLNYIDVSFMRIDYSMALIPHTAETEASLQASLNSTGGYPTHYALVDEDGSVLYSGSSGGHVEQLENGTWALFCGGNLYIDGELPNKLIFAAYDPFAQEGIRVNMAHSFTIDLSE